MSLLGRLKRWLSGGDDSRDDDATADTTDPDESGAAATSRNGDATTMPSTSPSRSFDTDSTDAAVPEAESETTESTDGLSVKCTVCGTVADSGTAACPLCGSTDVRPVRGDVDAVDTAPPGDVTTLVEEAESAPADAGTRAVATGRDSDRPDGDDERGGDEAENATDGATTVEDGSDRPKSSDSGGSATDDSDDSEADDEPRFAGRGPARTRSDRADDDAVNRLQELKRRGDDDTGDDGDADE